MTGKPAVCLATLRPAATSLAKGVADATLDHVPLLAVPGQADLARLWRESHQMIDLAALFDPITKQSRTILTPAAIASAVAEALRVATAPRSGAVHLSPCPRISLPRAPRARHCQHRQARRERSPPER